MLLCLRLVGYGLRMLYCERLPLQIPGTTRGACCSCLQPVVLYCCFRIYGWAAVILVRLLAMSTCMWQWEDWLLCPQPIAQEILHIFLCICHSPAQDFVILVCMCSLCFALSCVTVPCVCFLGWPCASLFTSCIPFAFVVPCAFVHTISRSSHYRDSGTGYRESTAPHHGSPKALCKGGSCHKGSFPQETFRSWDGSCPQESSRSQDGSCPRSGFGSWGGSSSWVCSSACSRVWVCHWV